MTFVEVLYAKFLHHSNFFLLLLKMTKIFKNNNFGKVKKALKHEIKLFLNISD